MLTHPHIPQTSRRFISSSSNCSSPPQPPAAWPSQLSRQSGLVTVTLGTARAGGRCHHKLGSYQLPITRMAFLLRHHQQQYTQLGAPSYRSGAGCCLEQIHALLWHYLLTSFWERGMYQVSAKITMNGKFGYMTQTSLAHVWVAGCRYHQVRRWPIENREHEW